MAGYDQRPGNGNTTPRFSLGSDDGEDSVGGVPSVTLYRGVASSGGVDLFV